MKRELTLTEQNNTLNGRLLAHVRPEDERLRHSFGFWRVIEERMIREEMIAEGLDPKSPAGHFEVQRRVTENHKNDHTFREISAAFVAKASPAPPDLAIEALRQIAAGHNDARALAIETLAKLGKT